MTHAVYIGSDPALQGKTAIIKVDGAVVRAQFDDTSTGLGHGWHSFTANEFRTTVVLTEVGGITAREANGGE